MNRNEDSREEERIRRDGVGKRALLWLPRKIGVVALLALAIIAASYFSPFVKNWLDRVLFAIDYRQTATQLTHEMEKVGELIAVRNTDTGIMEGDIKAKLLGSVSHVTAPYRYEIGLGVKLEQVTLTPGENRLIVAVPPAEMLYDRFEITGKAENRDFWGLSTQDRYQALLNEQQAACRRVYLEDPVYMQEAWDSACEQLEALFRQWSGENLRLEFVPISSGTETGAAQ